MNDAYRLHRSGDPDTSAEAADLISAKLTEIQQMVLRWAKEKGQNGFVDLELERAFPDYGPSTLRTRRRELTDAGEIEDTGERVTVGNNRKRVVWRVKNASEG